MKKLTKQEFITKANKIHNFIYDYSNVIYENNHTKVTICCKKHGHFLQVPRAHLTGKGCYQCSPTKQSNTQEFIKKALNKHGNLYIYDKVDYKNCEIPVEIMCRNHGSFFQIPRGHLYGYGCPKCLYERLSNITVSKSQLDFLDFLNIKQRNVHVGKFIVDGLEGNIIYEFLGDYWHANPEKFNPQKIHPHYKLTFLEVYNKTFDRFKILKTMGYRIKYIWENDWNQFQKGKINNISIFDY